MKELSRAHVGTLSDCCRRCREFRADDSGSKGRSDENTLETLGVDARLLRLLRTCAFPNRRAIPAPQQ